MLYKILSVLKEEKEFISEEDLAKKFNLTKTSICKNIVKLRDEGYNIVFLINKGYKLLSQENDIFNQIEIKNNLDTTFIGKELIFFDEIDSTNEFAKKNSHNFSEGTCFVTSSQTLGKGRMGRTWISEKNKIIALSLILKPKINIIEVNKLTLIMAIAVCRTIRNITYLNPMIKWPNDIIINNKKVSGILTEVISEFDLTKVAIVGIGINVNNDFSQNIDLIKKATSLKLELGYNLTRTLILKELIKNIDEIYNKYKINFDFEQFLEEYKAFCINIGKEVKLIYKNESIFGKVIDINKDGKLILINNYYEKMEIGFGEVSLRNPDGSYI